MTWLRFFALLEILTDLAVDGCGVGPDGTYPGCSQVGCPLGQPATHNLVFEATRAGRKREDGRMEELINPNHFRAHVTFRLRRLFAAAVVLDFGTDHFTGKKQVLCIHKNRKLFYTPREVHTSFIGANSGSLLAQFSVVPTYEFKVEILRIEAHRARPVDCLPNTTPVAARVGYVPQ
ncbi:hypothetical protein C8R46DRAFT_1289463 [Mycena filopes]|nr:hypothetical protein C8R46DRAFT_1289463 [Mycena filopes]